jgi:hypothetical protein
VRGPDTTTTSIGLAQLGDAQVDVTGLRGQRPGSGSVALVHTRVGAPIPGRADELGRFDLDELLQHRADRLAHQVDRFAGA